MFQGSPTPVRSTSKSHAMSRHDRICRIVRRNVARVACECMHNAAQPTNHPTHPARPFRRAA
jgi:hypothetical protein